MSGLLAVETTGGGTAASAGRGGGVTVVGAMRIRPDKRHSSAFKVYQPIHFHAFFE